MSWVGVVAVLVQTPCERVWSSGLRVFLSLLGKSALHWAAAVNNVDATIALLKNGANKDMQDLKVRNLLSPAALSDPSRAVKPDTLCSCL